MTALDDKQLEEFKNIVLEKNNIVLDEEIVKLLNKLEPKKTVNTYPYLLLMHLFPYVLKDFQDLYHDGKYQHVVNFQVPISNIL